MSEWISAEDRLPDDIGFFIGYGSKQVMEVEFVGCSWYCVAQGDSINVTHWMPLPEPPELEQ